MKTENVNSLVQRLIATRSRKEREWRLVGSWSMTVVRLATDNYNEMYVLLWFDLLYFFKAWSKKFECFHEKVIINIWGDRCSGLNEKYFPWTNTWYRPVGDAVWARLLHHSEVYPCWRKHKAGIGFGGLKPQPSCSLLSMCGWKFALSASGSDWLLPCPPHPCRSVASLWNISQSKLFLL